MDKVLEIGHFSAGFCGRLFAQNGADVVRIKQDPLPSWVTSEAMDLYLHSDKKMVESVSYTHLTLPTNREV